MSPETASGTGGPENSEWDGLDLRDQVRRLESALLTQQDLLQQCGQRLAIFEEAAGERLRVIQQGAELLKDNAAAVLALEAEAAQLRLQVRELASTAAGHAEERQRLQRACREAGRGMEELASRERTLTRENLELRNERLIHSVIRRLSSLFS